jgi:hypothetical protein
MTGLVRKATLLAVCGLLAASVAAANVPDPANCEAVNTGALSLGLACPKTIYVVGDNGTGVADPVGEFCVTVRDFNNIPIENSLAIIDFSNCDVQLCFEQDAPGPDINDGVQVDCVSRTVRKLTDASGEACFSVRGKTKAFVDCTALKGCVEIFADGVFLAAVDAAVLDLVAQDGEDGLNPNDLSVWLFLSFNCLEGPYRGNYDCTTQGLLDPNDLSVWLFVSFGGNSAANCAGAKTVIGPKCPD